MNPLAAIQAHLEEIRRLGARCIGVFGSFARGEAQEDSQRTYDNFFALHELLQQLAGRRVDLVTDKSLTETKARLLLPAVRYVAGNG